MNELELQNMLCEAIQDAIDEIAAVHRVTIGDAMNSLFAVMVHSAQKSDQYDPVKFRREMNDAMNQATELQ